VVDDYAHHPTKLRATISGARQRVGDEVQLVVVHVPHTYSRTLALLPDYADAFRGADLVVLGPIEPARERGLAHTVSSADVAPGGGNAGRSGPVGRGGGGGGAAAVAPAGDGGLQLGAWLRRGGSKHPGVVRLESGLDHRPSDRGSEVRKPVGYGR